MKESNLSFWPADLGSRAQASINAGAKVMAFDFDKAAEIIKQRYTQNHDLVAEAGLQGDWAYTGGVIFADGNAVVSEYTYLASVWAKPTLILSCGGEEQETIACFCEENERFNSASKWDEVSLKILGRPKQIQET